jgi:hypothetical protein
MDNLKFERWATAVGLDRYGVISSLVSRSLTPAEYNEEMARTVASYHLFKSNERELQFSLRTIQRWVSWYLYGHCNDNGVRTSETGIDALKPARRSDCGSVRMIRDEIVDLAVRLRSEEPSRSTATLIGLIQAEYAARGEEAPHIVERFSPIRAPVSQCGVAGRLEPGHRAAGPGRARQDAHDTPARVHR